MGMGRDVFLVDVYIDGSERPVEIYSQCRLQDKACHMFGEETRQRKFCHSLPGR